MSASGSRYAVTNGGRDRRWTILDEELQYDVTSLAGHEEAQSQSAYDVRTAAEEGAQAAFNRFSLAVASAVAEMGEALDYPSYIDAPESLERIFPRTVSDRRPAQAGSEAKAAGSRAASAAYVAGILLSSLLCGSALTLFLFWRATGTIVLLSPANALALAGCTLGWAATCVAGLLGRRERK